ncbi:hypothetical protein OROGR_033165 [Orobanche gracilis]
MKGKFLEACMKKCRIRSRRIEPYCDMCCRKCPSRVEECKINVPTDVPKGHLVVYVGEYRKRFVIRVTLLNHQLFQKLLDQAREAYGFDSDSRLCIPCDENMFLAVVQRAGSRPDYGCL